MCLDSVGQWHATGHLVGVSNVFGEPPDAKAVCQDLQGIAAINVPGRPIAGYERGAVR
jgi:hypothetical protein